MSKFFRNCLFFMPLFSKLIGNFVNKRKFIGAGLVLTVIGYSLLYFMYKSILGIYFFQFVLSLGISLFKINIYSINKRYWDEKNNRTGIPELQTYLMIIKKLCVHCRKLKLSHFCIKNTIKLCKCNFQYFRLIQISYLKRF